MRLEDEVSRMIWEGSPVLPRTEPSFRNSSFPEVSGRTKPEAPTAWEIAGEDHITLKSGSMDGRE
ncbi:hypothetical protein HYZ06_00600 [Candidatus Daviesbacteria bacterium]|nr:hypothetical protein [Candidatus Daviesbacteria bacterium]